jgi:hypothetical protein
MILKSTTEKIVVTTSTGADIDFFVSYADLTTEANDSTSFGKITTATDTDVLAAPAASTQRLVMLLSLNNIESSVDQNVVLSIDNSGTKYRVYKGDILRGEQLLYVKGEGWKRYNAEGKLIFVGDTGLTGASGSGSSTTWVAYSDADHTAVDGEGYNIQSSNISGTHSEDVSGITDYCEFMNGQDDPSKVVNLIGETVYASGGLEIITTVPTLGHTTLKRIGGILILY